MDRWVVEGWTEVGVSIFSMRKMPSPTQPFLKDKGMKGYSLEKL